MPAGVLLALVLLVAASTEVRGCVLCTCVDDATNSSARVG